MILLVVGPDTPAARVAAGPGPTSTTTAAAPDSATTFALLPVGGGSPLPTTTTSPATPRVVVTTTTVPPPAPVVTGAGAVLTPPAGPLDRSMPDGSCRDLADPGFAADCGPAQTGSADLVWLTESGPGGGLRAYVFRHGTGKSWSAVLSVTDDTGTRFAHIKVRVGDPAGNGYQQLAFGFLEQGSGAVLSVDLVDGTGVVVVHRRLDHGSARVSTGELDDWSAAPAPPATQQPACCPSTFSHGVVRYTDGAWRLVSASNVSSSAVPPSEL